MSCQETFICCWSFKIFLLQQTKAGTTGRERLLSNNINIEIVYFQYVMSDIFVHDVPTSWQRLHIRPTPVNSWLNPRLPPPLSQVLKLIHKLSLKQKLNFSLCPSLFKMVWQSRRTSLRSGTMFRV